jgi:hypothetical protein
MRSIALRSQNIFAVLEVSNAEIEINSAWQTIRNNITISAKDGQSYYEMKKHNAWFHEICSK